MRTAAVWLTVVISVAAGRPAVSGNHEWNTWRGANRDGRSADVGLLKKWPAEGPRKLWTANGIGEGYSSPVMSKGTIYITGKNGNNLDLAAFSMDGAKKWQRTIGPAWTNNYPGSRGTSTVDGDSIYTLTGPGLLVCSDSKTGAQKWQVNIRSQFGGRPGSWGYSESPLIFGNMCVVTPGGGKCVVALNKANGQVAWTSSGLSDPAHYSSAIFVNFQNVPMIIQMTGRAMVGLNASTGQFMWRNDRAAGRTAVCPSPVFSDGYAFGASGYGNGGACARLNVSGGRVSAAQAWETSDMVCHHGGYIVHEGHIYGNHSGGWNCLDLRTGQKKWGGRGVGKGSICYADGMIYIFSENGGRCGLAEAKPDGFNMVGQVTAAGGGGKSWAHPVVAGGRLYLRWRNALSAYDVKGPNYRDPSAAKPKPKPKPETTVAERPKPKPMPKREPRKRTPEELARRLWNSAQNFLRNNMTALAKRKLKELAEKYPETEYGKQARKKLKELAADGENY